MEAGSPHETFYKDLAAAFTQQTGVRVEILGVPHDGMHQQFLSDAIAGGTAYDVLMVDEPWIAEFAENGYLEPLDDRISEDERGDFVQGTLDTVRYDGSLYALPFLVHNLVTYYRPSLLTAAGVAGPPATWQEYRDTARLLTDTAGGTWGTMIPGNRDGEVATRFESYVQQAGGDIVDSSGHPDIDSPQALAALQLMTGIQFDDASSPPGLHDLSAIQGQFLEGKVAMVSVWPYLWAMATDPAQSKISDDVAVALNPGNPDQVATTFSWGFGVSAGSNAKEAAWKWVSWATGSDVLARKGVEQLSPVPRISAMEAVTTSEELTDRDRAALAVFSDSVSRSTTMPMTPLYSSYQSAMAEAVSSVMSRQASPDEALTTAQRQMEQAGEG
ncbi:ABC transporter substrate-binding protein [Kineococcus sp. SYSU DK003]|uniref:ABC transporter substrate-binding protein n=1 Tax=Kineococcus sp. SYSU DK003 TaxID=3383124 RepID=UPI003D7E8C8A